jgi:general secretion pathway protein N
MTCLRLTPNAVLLLYLTTAALGADASGPAQDLRGVTLSNPLAAQSMERLSAIVDRPLFSPNRRRPPTPPVGQDPEPPRAPPPPPPSLVLSGVVMDGQGAHVVVLVGAERRILRAQIGDEIDGWRVSQIEGRRLVVSLGDRFATFTLFNRDVDQQILGGGTAPKALEGSANAPQPLQLRQQNSSNAMQDYIRRTDEAHYKALMEKQNIRR